MAYDVRKIFLYGATGMFAAVLIVAVVFSTPMILHHLVPPVEARTGMLILKLTDAPVRDLRNLNLTIDKVEVCNETGYWTPLPILGGVAYFDLLKLENVTMDLSISEMPIGNYTKIRMRMVSANATLADGASITLKVPSGHTDIHVHFEIKPEKTTSLIIDIIVDKIRIAERGKSGKPANLNPQFKAIVIPPEE